MSGKLAITLRKSLITFPEDQRRTVRALGLKKLNQTVILPDNPSTRGAAFKVRHLVEVREAPEA